MTDRQSWSWGRAERHVWVGKAAWVRKAASLGAAGLLAGLTGAGCTAAAAGPSDSAQKQGQSNELECRVYNSSLSPDQFAEISMRFEIKEHASRANSYELYVVAPAATDELRVYKNAEPISLEMKRIRSEGFEWKGTYRAKSKSEDPVLTVVAVDSEPDAIDTADTKTADASAAVPVDTDSADLADVSDLPADSSQNDKPRAIAIESSKLSTFRSNGDGDATDSAGQGEDPIDTAHMKVATSVCGGSESSPTRDIVPDGSASAQGGPPRSVGQTQYELGCKEYSGTTEKNYSLFVTLRSTKDVKVSVTNGFQIFGAAVSPGTAADSAQLGCQPVPDFPEEYDLIVPFENPLGTVIRELRVAAGGVTYFSPDGKSYAHPCDEQALELLNDGCARVANASTSASEPTL